MQLSIAEVSPPGRGPGAICEWCHQRIPQRSRKTGRRTRIDAIVCDVVCRQASWRFGHERAPEPTGPARHFAYADPPYPGFAHLYADHPDYAGEVDHKALLLELAETYPGGWALSTSNKTLGQVLALIPSGVEYRVGAWTKPMRPGHRRAACTAWEPLIYTAGRPQINRQLLDWVHVAGPRNYPGQIVGTKPSGFCWWMFQLLGAEQGDRLDDLFPGSGAVTRAWARYAGDGDASLLQGSPSSVPSVRSGMVS